MISKKEVLSQQKFNVIYLETEHKSQTSCDTLTEFKSNPCELNGIQKAKVEPCDSLLEIDIGIFNMRQRMCF